MIKMKRLCEMTVKERRDDNLFSKSAYNHIKQFITTSQSAV